MPDPTSHPFKTIDQSEMRAINRSAVLEYLRLAQTASRTEISSRLNISLPTAKRIIDELAAEGLVHATGEKETGKGRSRELLELNSKHNVVIAVDLGGSHIHAALIDIGGEILFRFHSSQPWQDADENLNILIVAIKKMLDYPIDEKTKILGIAIGVPGIFDSSQGVVKLAPGLNWQDYPLLEKLQKVFNLPITIENDVNLGVLGEYWYGAGVGIQNLIMIAIGTGIGAGLIIDGKLYRGFSQSSGEIGYMLPGIQFLNRQYPAFGALEEIASGKGIAERAIRKLNQLEIAVDPKTVDSAFVFQSARLGKHWAQALVAETIDYLSLAIANVAACLDPEMIILGGGVSTSADLLIEPISSRLTGVIPNVPAIQASLLKDDATILGCVVRIFYEVTGYAVVKSC